QALVLGDGRVFAIGLDRTGGGSSAEIFDPATLSWRVAAGVPQIQQVVGVEAVQDGAVLVIGNGTTQALLVREGTVTPVGSGRTPVSAAAPPGDGRILVLSGAEHGEAPIAAATAGASPRPAVA